MDGLLDATSRSDAGPGKEDDTRIARAARYQGLVVCRQEDFGGTRRPVIGSDLIF